MMIRPHKFKTVYTDGPGIFTKNQTPGEKVYGEKLIRGKGKEYRLWNPRRSKLSAYILKGGGVFPFDKKSIVLYLGAANGTTPSHIADIALDGQLFCVEFSSRSFRDLLDVSRGRKQIMPILGDARNPEEYRAIVGQVDIVYQDVSQRDQVQIFMKNMEFLRPGGHGFLMLKARSVDSTKNPKVLYEDAISELTGAGYKLETFVELSPFQKDHGAIVVKKRR